MTLMTRDFLGHWQIERSIDDALTHQTARFSGQANISEEDTDWLYRERGHLMLQGAKPMLAERRYLWRPDATGFDIFFSDARFFHRLELKNNAQAAHWCDPDQYDVSYDFSAWPKWQSNWVVQGPKKKYVMKTQYSAA